MNSFAHEGFTVNTVTELPELDAVLYRMTHDQTGLELVWLKRDEENKTFAIAFETLPWDDTGVFHILEHSVLCGSDRYPVKEPFVELMKSSLNTFLNAFTFPDKTVYPVSSRNEKDFLNLIRVYLDAVFCPLIDSKPEIFYQEGWHYELDEQGNVGYKGVVFNEMKGAFASADELVMNGLNRELFPDSPYRFVSGGDPASIPDLTYEAFVNSHRRFYSPSNAYVFLDGNVDVEKVLDVLRNEYLSKYPKTERMAPPVMQKAVSGRTEGVYELASGETLEGKTRLAFGKVIGSFAEREKLIAAQILAEALCGSNQSPLCRAVLNEGLAEEVTMSVNDGVLQPWLLLEVKDLKEENLEKVEKLIASQLENLACNGLNHDQLEAVMANLEFKLRERDYGYYPQGIVFGFSALETWLYGGDPAANLVVGDLFVKLKQKMQTGYFENLIRELLLDNPHNAVLVLRPSHSAGEERRAAEQTRLNRETSAWSEAERLNLTERQKKLIAWQESQDTPEVLATIPQLSLEDIPVEPERIPTDVEQIAGIPVIRHDLHTGGIAYVNLYFDADCCTEEELSCLSFACKLLGETDTATHSAEEIVNKTRLLCGNFRIAPSVYVVDNDLKNTTVKLCVSFSALEANLSEAMLHAAEILTQSRFADETARDILRQTKTEIFESAVMSGHAIGLSRVLAQFSAAGVVEENIGGICCYQWLKQQDENWDFTALQMQMTALLERIVNRSALTVSVSGAETADTQTLLETIAQLFPARAILPKQQIEPWGKRKEGIVIPADIAFAVAGGNLKENGGTCCGQLQLASQIVSLGYLWNVIRVQGGAYGTGMLARDHGLLVCYSYRDPNGVDSLARYQDCAAFLRETAESGENLTGFIIGAVANASPFMTAKTRAKVGDTHYFTKNTWEDRCEKRRQLLNANADDLLAIADDMEKTLRDSGICLVGGQAQLEQCAELENVITL